MEGDRKEVIRRKRLRGIVLPVAVLVLVGLLSASQVSAQIDRITQVAMDTVKMQLRLPKDMEVRLIQKRESPLHDFYSVQLLLMAPDQEIPLVVYVDKTAEKVIIGSLFIKGENVTLKEAGPPRPRKVDPGRLELGKSPSRGPSKASMTIVEFSNFECSFCQMSWVKMQAWMGKYFEDIQYVFKHFPFQSQGKAFETSEMAASAQKISNEAFWVVHDFLFSPEGQAAIQGERDGLRQKIEQMLKERGYDLKPFQLALETGEGRRRVEEDRALGQSLRIQGTPTILINGEFIANPVTDQVIEKYLKK